MSKPSRDVSEAFTDFLTTCARTVLGLGAIAMVIAVAFLVYTCVAAGGATPPPEAAALRNVAVFQKILLAGSIAVAVGSTYLWWGEELLGAVQILFAGLLFFAPLYLGAVFSANTERKAVGAALGALQMGGTILGVVAIAVVLVDVAHRVRNRAKHGVKADGLKYGKGVKEEGDRQNVFLGKCWQLPYCRKFVRERCPIFHSKKCCWKEKVGCMCEEEVIRNAMENKPIPKDALLAANFIPRNNRLTENQKKQRCKSCVIYNEHQRHKYRAWLPLLVLGFGGLYALLRTPLLAGTTAVVEGINKAVAVGTFDRLGKNYAPPPGFVEMLLVIFVIVMMTYALRLLEFLIFKLKV